jgi:hypothetical protein
LEYHLQRQLNGIHRHISAQNSSYIRAIIGAGGAFDPIETRDDVLRIRRTANGILITGAEHRSLLAKIYER